MAPARNGKYHRNPKLAKAANKSPGSSPALPREPSDGAHDSIILVDSDSGLSAPDDENAVVVVSDSSDENLQPPAKKSRLETPRYVEVATSSSQAPPREAAPPSDANEVAGNNDFIGFGFESSEESDADEDEEDDHGATQLYPWVKGQDHSQQKEIADWLTLEIKDFVNYISPSKDEIMVRNDVIGVLKENIQRFWPSTQAHVFGSCATDLYLPGSDIDMVVISSSGDYELRQRLYQLSSHLRTHKLAKNIEVIANAKVPIIKFVDPSHNLHVDVSFERTNGIDAARRIRRWLDLTPGLRELVLIIKQFLRSRKLNNVHMGGLGGYATIIMVYHFLKLHPRVATNNILVLENLGTLLIEFFELYGRNFSYDNLIISLNQDDLPRYLPKYKHPYLGAGRGLFCIVIQDPLDPTNNITRSSYNLRDLKKAFGGAYQLLTSKCFELHSASYKNRIGQLILGDIIKFNGESRDFNDDRDLVINSALILHEDDESDGAEGNDKYYLSDMSELELSPVEKKKNKRLEKRKAKKKMERDLKQQENKLRMEREQQSQREQERGQAANSSQSLQKQKVSDYLSLEADSDDDLRVKKTSKRDYWSLKGLEASV